MHNSRQVSAGKNYLNINMGKNHIKNYSSVFNPSKLKNRRSEINVSVNVGNTEKIMKCVP